MKNYTFLRAWIQEGADDHPFQYARKQKNTALNHLFGELKMMPNNWYSNLRGMEAKKTKLGKYAKYFNIDPEELRIAQSIWIMENVENKKETIA